MEIYKVKIFVKAKTKEHGLTVSNYYEVHSSWQHMNDKCFGVKNDNGDVKGYNILCFELE